MEILKEYGLYIQLVSVIVVCIFAIVLSSLAKNLIGKRWLVAGNILLLVWPISICFQFMARSSGHYEIYDWYQVTNIISYFHDACFALFFLSLWANTRIKLNTKKLLFSFNGRIPRSLFWLVGCIFFPVTMFIEQTVIFSETKGLLNVILWIIFICWLIISLWVSLAVYAKRWHDCGKSGWMSLILFIPIIGSIWLMIYLGFVKGSIENNEYGEDIIITGREVINTNTETA